MHITKIKIVNDLKQIVVKKTELQVPVQWGGKTNAHFIRGQAGGFPLKGRVLTRRKSEFRPSWWSSRFPMGDYMGELSLWESS